ncbi:MAG TPA: alpha/beta hydrolase [Bacilli bacterium]
MNCVLFIHGFLSDHHDFDAIIPYLSLKYHHLELLDLPGHGPSFGDGNFEVEKTLDFVLEIYDKLFVKYKTIDVFGYSMGGALAYYLAIKRKINKLILLAPACKYFNFRLPFSRIKNYLRLRKSLNLAKENNDVNEINSLQEKIENIKIDDNITFKFIKEHYLTIKFPIYFLTFRKLIKEINKEPLPINTPTLLLYGEIDQIIPKASITYLSSLCRNSKVIIYDDVCHLMLLANDCTKIINDILDFLE